MLAAALAEAQRDRSPDAVQPAGDEHYLWPENLRAWQCWIDVQTQWRMGVSGATGLDYAGVRAYLDEEALAGDERREVFAGIRAAERATLEVLGERREREQCPPVTSASG